MTTKKYILSAIKIHQVASVVGLSDLLDIPIGDLIIAIDELQAEGCIEKVQRYSFVLGYKRDVYKFVKEIDYKLPHIKNRIN